jgi:uncharacterized protein (DUF2141 family)
MLLSSAAALANEALPVAELDVSIQDLRAPRGMIRLCLTGDARFFPDCGRDPHRVAISVDAHAAGPIRMTGIAPGIYALLVMHDENGNGRLDRSLGIPREGFGFSRNPRVFFGPPSFAAARFVIKSGMNAQNVRMKYLL